MSKYWLQNVCVLFEFKQ